MLKNLFEVQVQRMLALFERFVGYFKRFLGYGVPDLDHPANMSMLLRLLDGVKPVPRMQFQVLMKFWQRRFFPYNPQEFILVKDDPFRVSPNNLRVLVRYRDLRDPHFPDSWHFPGGYLGSDERVEDAVQQVAKKEAGVGVSEIITLPQANFPKLKRDHEYSTIHLCRMEEDPALKPGITMVVPLGALPEKFLPHHIEMAERVKDWLGVMRRVEPELRKEIIRVYSVLESSSEL